MNIRARLESWIKQQWSRNSLFSWCLRPFSYLSKYYLHLKASRYPLYKNLNYPPIIVVGNIIVGGAGKTPVVLAITQHLKQQGWKPAIISRGYGIKLGSHARVGTSNEVNATLFGDEPTLLAQEGGVPIAVHPKRIVAIKALLEKHPDTTVIIADDGLQHRAMPRDLEIIVQDQRGIGNGLLLPAGPLREKAERLTEADWLITQLTTEHSAPITPVPPCDSRHVTMRLQPTHFTQLSTGIKVSCHDWLQKYIQHPCSAVAAIGQPIRFFTMLKQLGIELDQTLALADHQIIAPSIFSQLNNEIILITAKDAVKCTQLNDKRIWVVHVQAHFTPSHWLHTLEHELEHAYQLRQT